MTAKKKMRPPSAYAKKLLALLDEYEVTTGDKSGDLLKAAKWLHDNNKMDEPRYDPIKAMAKQLSSASRQDYVPDDNGEPVRRRHCFIVPSEGHQLTFSWFKIEDATPEKMKMSVNYRRNGTLLDLMQLVRDVNFYNKKYNPGDPIPVDANFQPDIDEMSLPADYDEGASDEDQPDDES